MKGSQTLPWDINGKRKFINFTRGFFSIRKTRAEAYMWSNVKCESHISSVANKINHRNSHLG